MREKRCLRLLVQCGLFVLQREVRSVCVMRYSTENSVSLVLRRKFISEEIFEWERFERERERVEIFNFQTIKKSSSPHIKLIF